MYSGTGKIWALDINKGRLRILMDAAKLHGLDDMITDIHADLRLYAVSSHESSHKPRKRTEDFLITLLQSKYFRNMTSDHHGFMVNDLSTYMIRKFPRVDIYCRRKPLLNMTKYYWMLHALGWESFPRYLSSSSTSPTFHPSSFHLNQSESGATSYCIIKLLF